MRNFTKSLLALALMFVCVGGANSQTYHAFGGQSQQGWSWGVTETFPTSGVVGYTFTSQWASVGLMGGYETIDISDYPNYKGYLEGTVPASFKINYNDGSEHYPAISSQNVVSGTMTGATLTKFNIQATAANAGAIFIRDVVFYKDDEATGIHPTYVAPTWGGKCLNPTLSFTGQYAITYITSLDNAVDRQVTITSSSAIPDGINLYYRVNGSDGPEKWVSLSGKTTHTETINGTIYAIGIQCGKAGVSDEDPVVVADLLVSSSDIFDPSKNHVLKVVNSAAKSNIWDNSVTYSLASALTPGTTYTVSAKICAADVTRGTVMKFVLTGSTPKYGDEIAILASTFTQVSAVFTAGADNTGLEIEFGFANGVVYIDDVSCVEDGSSTNLIDNSDFEEPLSTEGWSVPGWTGQALSQAEQELGEISLGAQKVTIGSDEWATIVASNPLSVPGDVNAYFAKYDSEKGNIKLTAETTLPQWGRGIVNGEPGDYYFPQIASGDVTASWDDNGMEISWGSVKGDGSTIYAFGKKNSKVGFILVGNNVTIPSGKPYIAIAGGGARDFLGFDDETTGIEAVEQAVKADNQYFNLAGQRVTQPTKGLYIVNGKKVIIK